MTDTDTEAEALGARMAAFWQPRISAEATWHRMDGGRTNPVWRVERPGRAPLVCKLFLPGAATPLFANNPRGEAIALTALAGTDLAPDLLAFGKAPDGQSLLYTYQPGAPWCADVALVARRLRELHGTPPPAALPMRKKDPERLIEEGRFMAVGTGVGALPPPPKVQVGAVGSVFLHGDPVPGNLMVQDGALTLIDWQCPAVGDACDDLAIFLSPAMQVVNGNPPLTADQVDAFLAAYGEDEVTQRYRSVAPVYHWRMAAYCLWKAARGAEDYAAAAALELACL